MAMLGLKSPKCTSQLLPSSCATILRHHSRLITRACAPSQLHQTHSSAPGSSFDSQLQQLAQWRQRYGTCHVPRSAVDAAHLAAWVAAMRQAARRGALPPQQQQQLEELGFVWRPDAADAKWHANYHTLRCWLDAGGSWQLLKQHQHQRQQQQHQQELGGEASAAEPAEYSSSTQLQQPQELVPLPAEVAEALTWLQRQVELYRKLKLTATRVHMLRQLGVKLQRQPGQSKPNLHPILQGLDPTTYVRRPIQVEPATGKGKAAVGRLLAHHKQQQQQQGSLQQPFVGSDADSEFMLMLAELQRWRRRHGSCIVPPGVFDRPRLAAWVQHLRQLHNAAAAAPGPAGAAEDQPCSIASSSSSSDCEGAGSAGVQALDELQQRVGAASAPAAAATAAAAAAGPVFRLRWLKPWQLQELEALGFDWQLDPQELAWHARYHQLRHFRQLHHHINVAGVARGVALQQEQQQGSDLRPEGTVPAAGVPDAASGGESWAGLADWLQEQQLLLAEAVGVKAGRQSSGLSRRVRSTRRELLHGLGLRV